MHDPISPILPRSTGTVPPTAGGPPDDAAPGTGAGHPAPADAAVQAPSAAPAPLGASPGPEAKGRGSRASGRALGILVGILLVLSILALL